MSALKTIDFLASPHFNQRPTNINIDMIVLHAISLPDGQFTNKHITNFFLGKLKSDSHPSFKNLKDVEVSAHFVVDRKGNIIQFVPIQQRAWHAGESSWLGRENCNDFSVGIEMIGDEKQVFTRAQYTQTARLCRSLLEKVSTLEKSGIVGHQDIAPTRKWDPGKQWDWSHFNRSLGHIKHLFSDIA